MFRAAWKLMLALCVANTAHGQSGPSDSEEDHRRAGWPLGMTRLARPSDTGRYGGYYVGGGSWRLRPGEPRTETEGTWGWDYFGGLFKRRVDLDWWHGRRYQGGVGAYRTDGPHVLPPTGKD